MYKATKYYHSDITILNIKNNTNYKPYGAYKGHKISTIFDIYKSHPYIQLYCNKYYCCKCEIINNKLLCNLCNNNIEKYLIILK